MIPYDVKFDTKLTDKYYLARIHKRILLVTIGVDIDPGGRIRVDKCLAVKKEVNKHQGHLGPNADIC